MSGAYSSWSSLLLVGVAMLALGIRLDLLSLPEIASRCGACRRLVRRGSVCPCSRPRED
jgi:hypothetical protein